MITMVQGEGVGAGKSYLVLTMILERLLLGGTVVLVDTFQLHVDAVTDYFLRRGLVLPPDRVVVHLESDVHRIHELVPQGTDELPVLLVIDEAHGELNARDWADKSKRGFFKWLTQSRHDDVDVVLVSQHMHNVDKQVARLLTAILNVRNMAMTKVLGLFYYRKGDFRVNTFMPDGKTRSGGYWLPKKKELFALYNSKSCRGKHRATSTIAEPRKLLKVPKPRKTMKFWITLISIVLACLVLGGILLKQSVSKLLAPRETPKKEHPVSVKEIDVRSTETSTAGFHPVAFRVHTELRTRKHDFRPPADVIEETFRGTDGVNFLHTATGQYYVGQWSKRGIVVAVRGRVAMVRQANGNVVLVVGVEDLNPGPSE